MLIVSDTSPIINLAAIDYLWLLPKIYGQIILPQSVFDEIVIAGVGEPGADDIKFADWIEVQNCHNMTLWQQLRTELDAGEAEAIALAVEIKADRILIDERRGRQKAIDLSLRPVGILGVLIRAKQDGLISNLKPILDRLINDAGFFVNSKLYQEVLDLANE